MMSITDHHPHKPVLLEETVSHLMTKHDGIYLDCTIGFGGHSSRILEKLNEKGRLIGIDYDPYALKYTKNKLSEFKKEHSLFLSNYNDIKAILFSLQIREVDGILFDLGISSYQVDSGYKGLSYKKDSNLNMQLGLDKNFTLRDLLHNSSEKEIADIIYYYSEEKSSRKIARSIVSFIKKDKMETNRDLVDAINEVIPKKFINETLSRVFQSFRIKVNNELENLVDSIVEAIYLLKPGGRLAVITFHSIEDRIIKNILKDFSREKEYNLQNMGYKISHECKKIMKVITKKPIAPTWEEVKSNRRSRSAKLRVAERLL